MTQTVSEANSFDLFLDVRGLQCPLPILKTKKSLLDIQSGQILKIIATDKGSLQDMPSFCSLTGHQLLHTNTEENTYSFWIRKK
jgi:tRNA 2-thiouridine synthesizing protein A